MEYGVEDIVIETIIENNNNTIENDNNESTLMIIETPAAIITTTTTSNNEEENTINEPNHPIIQTPTPITDDGDDDTNDNSNINIIINNQNPIPPSTKIFQLLQTSSHSNLHLLFEFLKQQINLDNTIESITNPELGYIILDFALQHGNFTLANESLVVLISPTPQDSDVAVKVAQLIRSYVIKHGTIQGISFFKDILSYLARATLVFEQSKTTTTSTNKSHMKRSDNNSNSQHQIALAYKTIRDCLISQGSLQVNSRMDTKQQIHNSHHIPIEDMKSILRRGIGPRKWTKWAQLSNDQCVDDAIMEGRGTSMVISYLLCRGTLSSTQIAQPHQYVVDRAKHLAFESGNFHRADVILQSVGLGNSVEMLRNVFHTITSDRGLRTRIVTHLSHLREITHQERLDLDYLEYLERLVPSSSSSIARRRGWATFYSKICDVNKDDSSLLPILEMEKFTSVPVATTTATSNISFNNSESEHINNNNADRSSDLFREQPCCAASTHTSPRVSAQDFTHTTTSNQDGNHSIDLFSGRFLNFSLDTISQLNQQDRCRLALECGSLDKQWTQSKFGLQYFIEHGEWKRVREWILNSMEDIEQDKIIVKEICENVLVVSDVIKETITRAFRERNQHHKLQGVGLSSTDSLSIKEYLANISATATNNTNTRAQHMLERLKVLLN
jgi:hypothetical protein